MKGNSFTKEHSLMLKGVMIMMLLFHHVFYGDVVAEHGIILSSGRTDIFEVLVPYARLCLSGFAFITAYGITCQMMACSGGIRDYLEICVNRLVKISASCLFVYVIAVIYKRFVVAQSIKDVYRDAAGAFHPLYMVFDALGYADLLGTPKINVTWWYFSYAILLVGAIPAIFMMYRKVRFFLFPLVMFFVDDSLVGIAILGVLFAYEDVFGSLEKIIHNDRRICVCGGILIVCLFALASSYSIVAKNRDSDMAMCWAGALYAVIVMLFFSKIPVLSKILKWMGKHSATMFMTHTFIYMYFYKDFIYSFHRDYLIYSVLLGCSLATAIFIDTLRRLLRYDKLVSGVNEKIKWFLRTGHSFSTVRNG